MVEVERVGQISTKMKVSLFKNYYKSAIPTGEVEMSEWLQSTKYKKQVEAIRRTSDAEERRKMKSVLPAITPSGLFSKRNAEGLIRHSGLVCIDIDQKDNAAICDFKALQSTIAAKVKHLYYCGLSVSKNGLFCLIRIERPEKHAYYFNALKGLFARIGITIDGTGGDITRLRGVSYDESPYLNEGATPMTLKEAEEETALSAAAETSTPADAPAEAPVKQHAATCGRSVAERVGELVNNITETGTDITDSYQDWFAVGRALAAEFGEQGRNYYHAVSSQSTKYDHDQCDRQYNSCLRCCDRTTIATLFCIAARFGVRNRCRCTQGKGGQNLCGD